MGHIKGPGLPKPSFPIRNSDRRVLRGYCGAQQFMDQAHLPLESPRAQSEENCGPSSMTQSTDQLWEAAEDSLVLGRPIIPPR